jgi:hypothetical protein
MLHMVEFACNATRAIGFEHKPVEANFGFTHEERADMLFYMRTSLIVSQDATERLRQLREVHAFVRSGLELHKDEMQERSEPSKALHFV